MYIFRWNLRFKLSSDRLILMMKIAWAITVCTESLKDETKCLENQRWYKIVRHTERLSKEKKCSFNTTFYF